MADDVANMLAELQQAVLDPDVVNRSGSGKALQSVSQSSAIAVQDAVDNLRNISTISTTAIGVAISKYLETQMPFYLEVIQQAQLLVDKATTQMGATGSTAAAVMKDFHVD